MYQKYNFENLEIYQPAEDLAIEIYQLSKLLPVKEEYVLIAQLKRAVISIMLNIAEGSSRKSKKDFSHFIDISIGSLFEVKSILLLSVKLDYLSAEKLSLILPRLDELFFKLLAFKKYLHKK